MAYNTRRKSISLTALGIILPHSARISPSVNDSDMPPQKRSKRVHGDSIGRSRPMFDATPPPSPPASQHSEDEDVDDEIVASVVKVLRQSGNRPHTVRELAFLLHGTGLDIVENSANPHAIISSRLGTYVKRGNAKKEQCLLEKQLVTVHPKRIYFYLSGTKAQPIPETELPAMLAYQQKLASPAPTDEDLEEDEMRRRRIMSPSPEVDLSTHDTEHDNDNMSESSTPSSIITRERTTSPMRYASPPLEGDEQEFSASAISLSIKHRSASIQLQKRLRSPPPIVVEESEPVNVVEGDHHTAAALLGYNIGTPVAPSSPLVSPTVVKQEVASTSSSPRADRKTLSIMTPLKLDHDESWGDLRSPENVGLHELDDLFEDL